MLVRVPVVLCGPVSGGWAMGGMWGVVGVFCIGTGVCLSSSPATGTQPATSSMESVKTRTGLGAASHHGDPGRRAGGGAWAQCRRVRDETEIVVPPHCGQISVGAGWPGMGGWSCGVTAVMWIGVLVSV